MRNVRLALALLMGASRVFCTAPSLAQTQGPAADVEFQYEKGPGAMACPEASQLLESVQAKLGYAPFRKGARHLLKLRITREAKLMVGQLTLLDRATGTFGERVILGDKSDCVELSASLILAMVLAIDPEYGAPLAEPEPEPPPPPPPKPQRAADTPIELDPFALDAPPKARPEKPFAWRLGISLHLAQGTAPQVGPGIKLQLGGRSRSASLAFEGRFDLPVSITLPDARQFGISLLGASLVPCWHPSVIQLCGDLFMGNLSADLSGLGTARSARTLFASLGIRAGLELPVYQNLRFSLVASMAVPLTPTRAILAGQEIFLTDALLATASTGFILEFL